MMKNRHMSQSGIIKLGDVIHIETGEQLNKSDMIPKGKYPVVNGGIDFSGNTDKYNNEANSITISQGGASAGYVNWIDRKFWAGAHCYVVTPLPHNDVRFLYHYIKFHEYNFMKSQQGAGIPSLNRSEIYKIPFPNLSNEKQKAIAEVLDTFTSLIANLETELASRQKQYEHYRNELLTFDENDKGVEWKTLGDIGTIYKGKGIQKADFVDEGMPCIHYGQVHTYYGFTTTETKSFVSEEMYSNSNKAKKGDLIIATTSEDVEACCKSTVWLGDAEPAISGDAHYFRHNQNPKYIGYLFMTEMFATQKRTAAVGAKVTRVHGDSILKFKFPIPTRKYQSEVVEKLDTFEALISNIKQELKARKKQYEYYMEKLLTI